MHGASRTPYYVQYRKKNPIGKRPLGRPCLRWEDLIKKDDEELGGRSHWKEKAPDRDGWEMGCLTGWS